MEKPMKYAYEVYLQKSFSKAAEKLYVSQPALSAIIKKLETELNTTLFDRSSKPLRLTDSGAYYIRCVEEIMKIEKNMNHYFQDLSELHAGNISIGTSTYFCSNILPSLLKRFQQKYPHIQFHIVENNSTPELKKLLQKGEIDFALSSNTYPPEEFDSFIYDHESIILAVPRSHPINEAFRDYCKNYQEIIEEEASGQPHPAVSLKPFSEEGFITIDKISDLYPRLLAMFREEQLQPKIIMHLQQMSSCYFFAANGFGSAIIRASTLQCVKDTGNLCFYYIDSPYANRTSKFYYKKNSYISKAMSAFMEFSQAE